MLYANWDHDDPLSLAGKIKTGGNGAARIEEEIVVTATGCRVITLFPAQDLFVANAY